MHCTDCKNWIPDNSKFCQSCGLAQLPATPVAPPSVPTANAKNRIPGVIVGLVGLTAMLVVIGVIGVAWQQFRSSDSSQWLDAKSSGKRTEARPRVSICDDTLGIGAESHEAYAFDVPRGGARIVGGLMVQSGGNCNLYVYPASAYADYPTNGRKPVHLEQIRNKRVNQSLPAGSYVLVIEANDGDTTAAAEFWLE